MKSILHFTFLFFAGSLLGQVITVSEPITMRNDIAYYIIGEQKDNVLLFRDKETEFEVQGYDAGMKMKWSKEIELDKGRPQIYEVIEGDGDFDVLYKYRKKGHYFLKIHRYDAAANLLDSVTIKDLGSSYFTKKFDIRISEDRSKVLMVNSDKVSNLNATVVDLDSMKVMWEKSIALEHFTQFNTLDEMLIDNQGNSFLVFDIDNRKISREDHRLEILTTGPDYSNIGKITIPFPGKLNYDAEYTIDNLNNRFIIGGLYSEKNKGRATGYYYLNAMLPTASQVNVNFQPFSLEQAEILMDKKLKEAQGVNQMEVQQIALRRDGGILLMAERVKLSERSGTTGTQMDTYGNMIVDYYYDNVFVASIHPTGATHWNEILHKRQFSQDDGASFSSYFLMKTPKNLRMIFNDEIRNENLVSEFIITAGGFTDRNSVFNTESQSLKLRFRDAVQIASNEIIVPSEKKNRIKLVRVTY